MIKPSGVDYDSLTPEQLVEVDLATGETRSDSKLRPSVDLPHHLYLYRNMPGVCGIIHTHSNYATALAALGRPIPVCLTAIADQFGAEIPCTPYVDNEGDHIGQAILRRRNRAPAILLGNHGVFAWGKNRARRPEGRRDDRGRGQDRAPGAAIGPASRTAGGGNQEMVRPLSLCLRAKRREVRP